MSEPDGPAEWREYYDAEFGSDGDKEATLADEQRDDLPSDLARGDEELLAIAQSRMFNFALDRMLR